MTPEIIIKETETISNSYTSRKGLTYEELRTKAEDWKACKIISYENNGKRDIPIFELPQYYTIVKTRFSQPGFCHLCGHCIEIVCYIRNDSKKWLMIVGTECVNNTYGKVIRKTIKEFKDNETRIKTRDFLVKYIEHCSTQFAYPYPKNAYEKSQLRPDAYIGKYHAQKILNDFDKVGIRKLANFMKKHEKEMSLKPIVQTLDDFTITNVKDLIFSFDNNQNRKIAFGKYKGMTLNQIPEDYIQWARRVIAEEVK